MAQNTIMVSRARESIFDEIIGPDDPGAIITPGMIMQITPDGTLGFIAENEFIPGLVIIEDKFHGKGIDDNYVPGSLVTVWSPGKGDVFYGIIGPIEVVYPGSTMSAHIDSGYLKVTNQTTPKAGSIIGWALDNVITGVDEYKRCRIQVF